jgi:hypothetical protein
MSIITIKINDKTKVGKTIKKLILSLINTPEIEIIEGRYNSETEKVIRDARAGKGLIKIKNREELIKTLNS